MGLIFQRASDEWTYLIIDKKGTPELRDATRLVGKDTWETTDAIVQELGERENNVSIMGDRGHAAAHNGVGAVMGSKKLKAVAIVRGKEKVPVADSERLSKVAKAIIDPVIAAEMGIHYYGTLNGVQGNYARGNLPIRNYTTNVWDIPEEEFEKFSAFSANLGITEVGSVMMLSNTVDRLGLDTNEAGWVCSCMMECFEKGIFSKEDTQGLQMLWGSAEATKEFLERIAHRDGR